MDTFVRVVRIAVDFAMFIALRIATWLMFGAMLSFFVGTTAASWLLFFGLLYLTVFHRKGARLYKLTREFFVVYILKFFNLFFDVPMQAGPQYAR